ISVCLSPSLLLLLQSLTDMLFPYTTLFRSLRRKPGYSASSNRSPLYSAPSYGSMSAWAYTRLRVSSSYSASPYTSQPAARNNRRSEEHTSELQSRFDLVCRLLLEKKNYRKY